MPAPYSCYAETASCYYAPYHTLQTQNFPPVQHLQLQNYLSLPETQHWQTHGPSDSESAASGPLATAADSSFVFPATNCSTPSIESQIFSSTEV
jgi:hypothetical protein